MRDKNQMTKEWRKLKHEGTVVTHPSYFELRHLVFGIRHFFHIRHSTFDIHPFPAVEYN